MAKMRRRVRLVLVTDGLTRAETEACKIGYYPLRSLQQAVDDALARYDQPTVTAIRHGGELFLYR
jgi:hypothetical protein